MSKTTTRQRAVNLYTVEQDGQPVAQAMAISQAEAVRLYVESVQQPTMSARLSSPLEARTLAGLPLLQREPATTDTKTDDLFEDVPMPTAPAVISREPDPETVDAAHEAECAIAAAHEIPAADLPAEFVSYIEGEEPAAVPLGEPEPSVIHAPVAAEQAAADAELQRQAKVAAERRANGGKPVAMYRNPADGASWSGRGLKPRWLVDAIEAGRTQDEFLIDTQGARA